MRYSSGAEIARCIKEKLIECDLVDELVGLVFDTTSSNTGGDKGMIPHLENHPGNILFCTLRDKLAHAIAFLNKQAPS